MVQTCYTQFNTANGTGAVCLCARSTISLRQHLLSAMLVSLSLFCTNAAADAPQAKSRAQNKPEMAEMIDKAHQSASALLNNFASQIDDVFADDVTSTEINNTRATLRFDFTDPADDSFSLSGKLKLRLVLPRSEQRFRLLLDVDDEDNNEDTRPSAQNLSDSIDDQNLSLALRFIRNTGKNLDFNFDLGARRFEQRVQGFARVKVSAKHIDPAGWSYDINNDLRQFFSSGYLDRLQFDFWRTLHPETSTVFRTSTSLEWRRNVDGAQINQTMGLYRELNASALIAYELLAGYQTSPAENENHYGGHQFRIRYRRNIWRPWFHFELWPGISWLTENDNQARLEGLVRVEVGLGKF